MSANSSNNIQDPEQTVASKPAKRTYSWKALLIFPAWVVAAYAMANVVIVAVLWLLDIVGITDNLPVNAAVFETIVTSVLYILTLVITLGVPATLRKKQIGWGYVGLQRLPSWSDIGLAPLSLVVYLLVSAGLIYVVLHFFPEFPHSDSQDVGFKALSRQYEYTLAFLTLVVIAPIAEEALFRGYLFGRLKKYVPTIPAIIVVSLLFAAAHLPGGDHIQWNVALDVFALSIILCLLRSITGSIWAGILLHMLKNAIAFYLMFISPLLLMGG